MLQKRNDHPDAKKNPRAPDEVIYRIMREPEQRVTALLNDEIQIAQFVPPHMRQRVEKSKNLKITPVDSVEIMFLAMQPKPPFDKKEVRQAVCHAINRDQIIIHAARKAKRAASTGRSGPGNTAIDPEFETETRPMIRSDRRSFWRKPVIRTASMSSCRLPSAAIPWTSN